MEHNTVFMYFKTLFPKQAEDANSWFPNGKDSIRVRVKDAGEYIFTYHATYDWRFETVDSYLNGMKRKEKDLMNA